MSATSGSEFLNNLRESCLLSHEEWQAVLGDLHEDNAPAHDEPIIQKLVEAGRMTPYQVEAVRGRWYDELVLGNYEVLEKLGSGGMGTVYKARHRRMKRLVALKLLPRTVNPSAALIKRFQREVELLARLNHPNIILAHDADEAAAGHFLIMEFVDGCDLATEVHRHGTLTVKDAVDVTLQAARALDYAHRMGIIHRDIKPANLLRDKTGVVKLADLGLARLNDALHQRRRGLTQSGSVMGTADFMAPEQAADAKDVDGRADIYSLGATLYYLLIGLPPYPDDNLMGVLIRHQTAPIPSLRAARADVPAALDDLFRRMLAKERDGRPPTMAAVMDALAALHALSDRHPLSPRSGTMSPADRAAQTVLPDAAPPAEAPEGTMDYRPPTATAEAPETAKWGRALLVEPSRVQASIIRKYLEALGLSVSAPAAPASTAVLAALKAAPPGVLLTALHLSDRTAGKVVDELRADPALAGLPVVVISSQADAREAELLGRRPGVVVLPKPFDQERLAQALTQATGRVFGEATGPAMDVLRVLIVDDSKPSRLHVRSVLTALGVGSIAEADNGAKAITVLERENFDLVVTDFEMPQTTGLELLLWLRNHDRTRAMPVVMVTSETEPAKLEAVRKLGVTALCDKSFPVEVARDALEKAASRARR